MTPIDLLLWALAFFVVIVVLAITATIIGAFVDAFRKRKPSHLHHNDHKIL